MFITSKAICMQSFNKSADSGIKAHFRAYVICISVLEATFTASDWTLGKVHLHWQDGPMLTIMADTVCAKPAHIRFLMNGLMYHGEQLWLGLLNAASGPVNKQILYSNPFEAPA